MKKRPEILVIGGFDPSGGAGVMADAKVSERLKCYAVSVLTANTIQSADVFESVNWTDKDVFFQQLDLILKFHHPKTIKIGLIQFDWMDELLGKLKENQPSTFVVWDPILSASAGFDFQQKLNFTFLEKIDLITPNWNEILAFGANDPVEIAKKISEKTNVYLKGGHSKELGKDFLFTTKGQQYALNPKKGKFTEKHGSGCVLSTSIACFVAREFPLLKSCYKAKRNIEKALSSNSTKLASHS